MEVLFCVALTVPPPVAMKAGFAPVLTARPPVKVMVDPVLLVSRTPAPVSVIAPLKVAVPPVRLVTSTEWLVAVAAL